MSLFNSIRLGASGAGDYEVKRSIRNDQGTADTNSGSNFSRTFGASGNRKTFTKSVWVKKCNTPGNIGDDQYSIISAGGGGSGSSACNLRFSNIDTLQYGSGASGSSIFKLWTNRKFRDPSAWYHIVVAVDTTQGTASDRAKMYINGVQETDFATADYPSQNADIYFNFDINHRIGSNSLWSDLNSTYGNFNGYIAEFNFIDGTALTPSSFGKTNSTTGQWVPKKYSGSYGTNGFYLNFSDNSGTTATTLGKDSSGNGNNFTPNNFSVSAGAGNDSSEDSPTNNFPTINPEAGYSTNFVSASNGNLDFSIANNHWAISTFAIPASGKWYFECVYTDVQSGDVSVFNPNMINDDSNGFDGRWNGIAFSHGEIRVDNSAVQSSLTSLANNTIYGILIDRDAGTVSFSIAGSVEGSAVNISAMTDSSTLAIVNRRQSSSGSNPIGSQNYGQRPFSHLPAGYKALCSANLPDPTIKLPNKHFDTLLYTGNNGSQNITGLDFDPDFVWGKNRQDAGYHHDVYDIVRGDNLRIFTSQNNAETTGYLQFGVTGGFSLTAGGGININAKNHVAWCWNAGSSTASNGNGSITSSVRANASAGFSVAGWTGTNGNGTVGHGLGVAPKVVIVRRRESASDWAVYHGEIGNTKRLVLNSAAAASGASASWWNNTSPTSTTFSVGSDAGSNGSTDDYIAYCFSEVAGYSKFGSYVGNNNADGVFVYLGFRPAYVMIKNREAGSTAWYILDKKRDPDNPAQEYLAAEDAGAEGTYVFYDFLSNGFKLRNTGAAQNPNGQEVIYLAFAESPFKYARAR